MTDLSDPNLDRAALLALSADPTLKELEHATSGFNLFEAIGAVRSELRHSDLLAFLLDPSESHNLGDVFVRRFLEKAFADTTALALLNDDLDTAGLEVRREWRNIDILLLDKHRRFVVVIENKIDSTAHSGQLARYWQAIRSEHPDARFLGVYLTPSGEPPDAKELPDEGEYVPLSYSAIRQITDAVVGSEQAPSSSDVMVVLRHYSEMLRRHIVTDPEIVNLCREIYKNHKHALELVFEHKLDPRKVWLERVAELIKSTPAVTLAEYWGTEIRFVPAAWDVGALKNLGSPDHELRVLFFGLFIEWPSLTLKLYIGPGPAEVRQALFAMAKAGAPFKPSQKELSSKWMQIWRRTLLDNLEAGLDEESQEESLSNAWKYFVNKDLPVICSKVNGTGVINRGA